MPPGTGDVQMGLARLLPRADMVIVTTPALAAQKVAQRAADMARRSFVRVVGVIENMTDFTCEHGDALRRCSAPAAAHALADADRRPAARPGPARAGRVGRRRRRPPGRPSNARRRPGRRGLRRGSPTASTPWPRATLAEADDMAGCSARLLAAVGAALEADTPPGKRRSSRSRRHLVTLRLNRRSGHPRFVGFRGRESDPDQGSRRGPATIGMIRSPTAAPSTRPSSSNTRCGSIRAGRPRPSARASASATVAQPVQQLQPGHASGASP